jgi:hypothetical protein
MQLYFDNIWIDFVYEHRFLIVEDLVLHYRYYLNFDFLGFQQYVDEFFWYYNQTNMFL